MKTSYKSRSEGIKGYGTKLSKSEKSDCVVCALAAAFNISYNKAHKFASDRYNRKNKRATYGFSIYTDQMAHSEEVLFGKIIKKHKPVDFKGNKITTIGQFKTYYKYRKGTFLISIRSHVFVVKNGTVIGNWNDATAKRTRIYNVWEFVNAPKK